MFEDLVQYSTRRHLGQLLKIICEEVNVHAIHLKGKNLDVYFKTDLGFYGKKDKLRIVRT